MERRGGEQRMGGCDRWRIALDLGWALEKVWRFFVLTQNFGDLGARNERKAPCRTNYISPQLKLFADRLEVNEQHI